MSIITSLLNIKIILIGLFGTFFDRQTFLITFFSFGFKFKCNKYGF